MADGTVKSILSLAWLKQFVLLAANLIFSIRPLLTTYETISSWGNALSVEYRKGGRINQWLTSFRFLHCHLQRSTASATWLQEFRHSDAELEETGLLPAVCPGCGGWAFGCWNDARQLTSRSSSRTRLVSVTRLLHACCNNIHNLAPIKPCRSINHVAI